MNESTDIIAVVESNPVSVLVDDKLYGDFYKRIKAEIDAFEPDLSTGASRKRIASMAYKVARTKTAIDAAGKKLNEEARAQISKVDAQRRKIREELDELSADVRRPLTEWEEARATAEKAIADIKHWANCEDEGWSLEELRRRIETTYQATDFMDLADDALEAVSAARTRLDERVELERLRKAEEARQEAERLKAEEEARQERERQEESARIERERIAAEQAELREQEAAERARQEERRKAEEALAAAEREKQAIIDAQKREADRIEAQKRAEAEEQARREADQQHRTAVKTAAKEALMQLGADEALAKSIVLAVIAGEVPNVTLRF